MYVVVHMLDFLNSILLFHSLPMGNCWTTCCLSVLHFTLCTTNNFHWTWKKKKEPLSLLVISLTDLWHGVGEDFTSQLAVVRDAVYCTPYLSVHGASSQCNEAVKDSNNQFPAHKLLKQVKGRTASTVTKSEERTGCNEAPLQTIILGAKCLG